MDSSRAGRFPEATAANGTDLNSEPARPSISPSMEKNNISQQAYLLEMTKGFRNKNQGNPTIRLQNGNLE
jgi:hypothetical protein